MNARRLTQIAPLALATVALSGVTALLTAAPTLAAPAPATIGQAWSAEVTATSATLNATINPGGAPASYYFQYSTVETTACTSLCTAVPAAPGEAIGDGASDVSVTPRTIQGLLPGAVYHYRAVAVSEPEVGVFATVDGPDQTFTTQTLGGSGLPDGRAWELVSPPNKHGSLIEPIGQEGIIQASASGNAITYHANAPFGGEPAGYANEQQMLSSRGTSGWATRDVAIPHVGATGASEGIGEDYRYFSTDLSTALVQPAGAFTALSPEASEQTVYSRADFPAGEATALCPTAEQKSAGVSCFTPLVTGKPGVANVPLGTVFGELGNTGGEVGPCPSISATCGPQFAGATPDAKHVIISTSVVPVDLTTTPAPGGGLYEWTGGALTLVSVLPEAEGATPAITPILAAARNAVSADGSRVFWTGLNGSGEHLYMRDLDRNETVELDAGLGGIGRFQIASTDGRVAFFTDDESLYECVFVISGGKLQCELANLGSALPGQVTGASEDGAWVYFVSNAVLAAGAPAGTCIGSREAPGATCALYVRHDHETKLVAVLSGADYPDWARGPLGSELQGLTARVSPTGHWLAFMSQRSLTGYDNRDANSGVPDEEVYLYNALREELRCASCNPTGSRPVGEEYGAADKRVGGDRIWNVNTDQRSLAANIPGWTPWANSAAQYQSRYLSNTGRLFFNSHEALVPQDTNGTWDVYEYEPPGIGSCKTTEVTFDATSNGCVNLISSGTAAGESAFLDASETGGDVFFMTLGKLASQDFDTSYDVYDAHECTSLSPCTTAAVSPPECTTAEACRAAPAPQPAVFGSPPSATFSGAGNFAPAPPPAASPKTTARLKTEKLSRALRICRKDKQKAKRVKCEKRARQKYGVKAKKATSNRRAR
jgi:hypothetical protein